MIEYVKVKHDEECYICHSRENVKTLRVAAEHDEKFTDIHPYRLPWADKYRNMDDISAEEFLAHGWWLPCAKCGKQVYEDTAVLTDTKVLCKECAGKGGETND